MKGLTLTPPWGTLVAVGAKQIETRSWPTNYRGLLAIHQSKGLNGLRERGEPWTAKWVLDKRLADLCDRDPFFTALRPHLSGYTAAERAADLPRGAIVAVAKLVECIPTETVTFEYEALTDKGAALLADQERAFGDFTPGRYAWRFERILNLHDGIECSGGRGLWDVPADVLAEIGQVADVDEQA